MALPLRRSRPARPSEHGLAFYVEERPGQMDTPCWIYTGAQDRNGYGLVRAAGFVLRIHRLLLAFFDDEGERPEQVAEIPSLERLSAYVAAREGRVGPGDHDAHHRCFERQCVRPGHTEWMLRSENRHTWRERGRRRRA